MILAANAVWVHNNLPEYGKKELKSKVGYGTIRFLTAFNVKKSRNPLWQRIVGLFYI